MIRTGAIWLAAALPTAAAAQDAALVAAAAEPIFAAGTHGDPFADTGLSQGCQVDASIATCTITSRGANLIATGDYSTEAPLALLMELPPNTPVAVTGDIVSYGDITAEIMLSTVETGDADPHAGTLDAMQGAWVSVDDRANTLEFAGTEQIESHAGEVQGYYLISVEDTCPEDPAVGGPVMYAQLLGGDPATDSYCYAILTADGATLQMSLVGGDGSTLSFVRP